MREVINVVYKDFSEYRASRVFKYGGVNYKTSSTNYIRPATQPKEKVKYVKTQKYNVAEEKLKV